MQAEDPTVEAAGRGTRRAHFKHLAHVSEAGRVEAQRLVERRRFLPSRKGKHKKRGERRAGRREIVGAAAAQAACRQRAQVQRLLAGARSRGAHVKHAVYGRDAGGVEAQRLVEGRRSLPSRKGRHKKSGERRTYGRGRAWARRRRKQRVQAEDPTVEAAGRGTRGAHVKHAVHGRDAGGVPAQRLVERVRVLPSRKGKHNKRGDRQAWRREGVGAVAAQAACRQRTRLWRLLAGARAERT